MAIVMEKNYLFDVDGLLQVLQAIKEGKPVEYRPLEEPDWRDFDPEDCDIDTENCKYRVKSGEYGENIGSVVIHPENLQEGRIYFFKDNFYNPPKKVFFCVQSNMYREGNYIATHFLLYSDSVGITLQVNDNNVRECHSVKSDGFANIIAPYGIVSGNFSSVEIRQASLAQVKMLESKLREIGYEFKNGEMKKLDGNKE